MTAKTFPYHIIWNGEIVPPNTPVEIEETVSEKETVEAKKPKRGARKHDEGAD